MTFHLAAFASVLRRKCRGAITTVEKKPTTRLGKVQKLYWELSTRYHEVVARAEKAEAERDILSYKIGEVQGIHDALLADRDSWKAMADKASQTLVEYLGEKEKAEDESGDLRHERALILEERNKLIDERDILRAELETLKNECRLYSHETMTAVVKEREELRADRDRLQHYIDCANTPMMTDVLNERDALRKGLEGIAGSGGIHSSAMALAALAENWQNNAGQFILRDEAIKRIREILSTPPALESVKEKSHDA